MAIKYGIKNLEKFNSKTNIVIIYTDGLMLLTLWLGNCSLKAAAMVSVVALPHCLSESP